MTKEKAILLQRSQFLERAEQDDRQALVYAVLAAGDIDQVKNAMHAERLMSIADAKMRFADECTENVLKEYPNE